MYRAVLLRYATDPSAQVTYLFGFVLPARKESARCALYDAGMVTMEWMMKRHWLVLALVVSVVFVMVSLVVLEDAPSHPSNIQQSGVESTSACVTFPARPSPTPRPPTPTPRRIIAAGQLVIGGDPEDIPAIQDTEPLLVDVATGNEEWEPDTLVIGLGFGGVQTAYPISFLSRHEVINDWVGPQPVLVTWCPLCFSAVVYERRVDQMVLTFRVSGYLFMSNLVLESPRTVTLWSQLTGISIRGGARPQQLHPLPFTLTTWGEWQTQFPETRVISGRLSPWADVFDYSTERYEGYFSGGSTGIGRTGDIDDRLPARAVVTGLEFDGIALAVPFNDVFTQQVIQTQVGEQPVVLFVNPGTGTPVVFSPEVDGNRLLAFEMDGDVVIDTQTSSRWDPVSGMALSGPLAGTTLRSLTYRTGFWFSWADFFPHTLVWGVDA